MNQRTVSHAAAENTVMNGQSAHSITCCRVEHSDDWTVSAHNITRYRAGYGDEWTATAQYHTLQIRARAVSDKTVADDWDKSQQCKIATTPQIRSSQLSVFESAWEREHLRLHHCAHVDYETLAPACPADADASLLQAHSQFN